MKNQFELAGSPASSESFVANDVERGRGLPLLAVSPQHCDDPRRVSPSFEVFVALQSGLLGSIAFDRFLGSEVIIEGVCQAPLDQTVMTGLELSCEVLGLPRIQRSAFRNLVQLIAAENPIDSAQSWMLQLAPWDRQSRCERFLTDYLGVVDTPYTRAVSRYTWSAMVASIMEPGCKVDMMPVLVGPQGSKKSSSLKLIAPTDEFCADVCLTDRPRDLAHTIFGRSLLIWENLHGIRSGSDFERVKAFLTRQYLEIRSQEKRIGMDRYPCRYVVFGTSNTSGFLRDVTGNRRFLPIRVGTIDLDKLRTDKLQLWAEALHRMQTRKAAGLSVVDYEDAERLAPAEHQKYFRQGLWFDSPQLEQWLKRQTGPFSTGEALEGIGLGVRPNQTDRQEMANSLRQLGCSEKRTRVNGNSLKRWHQP